MNMANDFWEILNCTDADEGAHICRAVCNESGNGSRKLATIRIEAAAWVKLENKLEDAVRGMMGAGRVNLRTSYRAGEITKFLRNKKSDGWNIDEEPFLSMTEFDLDSEDQSIGARQQLVRRVLDAIVVKLQEKSPTVLNAIDDLKQSSGYGVDAVLRTVLNSTIGGAGPQPNEAELVSAASEQEKQQAMQLVINQLYTLRDAQVKTETVSVLISKLQPMAG